MDNKRLQYYVIDEGAFYSVYSSDYFDKYGVCIINPSYSLHNLRIVAVYNSEKEAIKRADELDAKREQFIKRNAY